MNRNTLLVACLVLAATSWGHLQASVPLCPQGQTTVSYVNGVMNTYDSAYASQAALQLRLEIELPGSEFECLDFSLSYNASTFDYFNEILGETEYLSWLAYVAAPAADTAQALGQSLNTFSRRFWTILEGYAAEKEWDWLAKDFADRAASVDRLALLQAPEIEVHAQEYVHRINVLKRKVVVVGHSQGNFYANQSYRLVPQEISESLGLVAVATFDSFVAGQDRPYSYTTLAEDAPILAAIAFAASLGSDGCTAGVLPFPEILDLGPMCPNIANLGASRDPLGHNFINAYLVRGSNSEDQIMKQVRERVAKVKNPATKFVVGDRVRIADVPMPVGVLNGPSGSMVGTQSPGSSGVIRSSPRYTNSGLSWYVDFDDGVDGWVLEEFLVAHEDDGLDVRVSFVNNETCGDYGVCSVVLEVGEWADIASFRIEIEWGDGTTLSAQTLSDCLSAGACQHLGDGRYRVWKLYAESRVTPYPVRVSYGVVGGTWVNEAFSANVSATKALGLNATPGDARVDLSWANVSADRYNVCRATQPVAVFDSCSVYAGGTLILDVGAPPRWFGGLTNGTTYHFRVEAQFGKDGLTSEGASATPQGGVAPSTGGPLNDTGIAVCGQRVGGAPFPCLGYEPQGEDALLGRDALARAGQLRKIGGGGAGFDFTKISNNGATIPSTAELGRDPSEWACTRDNVTGLLWEVKVDDPDHYRDYRHVYEWRVGDPSPTSDRAYFLSQLNAEELCGVSDWRMPTRHELLGIVDYGREWPAIDPIYFINTWRGSYWAWGFGPELMDFIYGRTGGVGGHVRAVSGGTQ